MFGGVTATSEVAEHATNATEPVRVRFDVIKTRVAERLNVDVAELTDIQVAEYLGQRRDTINKLKNGHRSPLLDTVLDIAEATGLKVEDIVERGESE